MELLKILLGLIVIVIPFVLMYGLGRLSIGKKYNENYDFAEVMIEGLVILFLIAVGILILFMGHLVGDDILTITKTF